MSVVVLPTLPQNGSVDTALALIKGVIEVLKADTDTSGLVADRIYTDVPQDSDFPYVVVSVTSEPFAAQDFSGQTHALRIQGFSREKTIQQSLAIRRAALKALDRQEFNIDLDEGNLILCQYSGASDAFKEDDGKTWQSVGELEVLIQ